MKFSTIRMKTLLLAIVILIGLMAVPVSAATSSDNIAPAVAKEFVSVLETAKRNYGEKLAYADLIDFDGNGIPELYMVSRVPESGPGYQPVFVQEEIWTLSGTSAEKTYSELQQRHSDFERYLCPVGGKIYLVSTDMETHMGNNWQILTVSEVRNGTPVTVREISEYRDTDWNETTEPFWYYSLTIDGNEVCTNRIVPDKGYVEGGHEYPYSPEASAIYDQYNVYNGASVFTLQQAGDLKTLASVDIDAMISRLKSAAAAETGLTFWDVAPNAWYRDAVAYVCDRDLMGGRSSTIFAPNDNLSRAEICALLCRMAGGETSTGGNSRFQDVHRNSWYYSAVNWAADKGLVTGMGNNCFFADNPVTREQLATILYRFYRQESGDMQPASGDLSGFTDVTTVSPWAYEALQWAVGSGLVTGTTDTTLSPKETATRAATATMILRFDKLLSE